MDTTWLQARITACKARIESLEAASASLATGKISSYTLDTGQTREVVTRQSLGALQRAIDAEYNRLATLEARLYGGTTQARPGW